MQSTRMIVDTQPAAALGDFREFLALFDAAIILAVTFVELFVHYYHAHFHEGRKYKEYRVGSICC